MSDRPFLIFDMDDQEWRCGHANDDGPTEVVPSDHIGKDMDAWKKQLGAVLEAMEVDDPSEYALILTEQPGTAEGDVYTARAKCSFERPQPPDLVLS